MLLAGPLAFACAALVMCGAALWVPRGPAQIDNIVLPIVLFPALWAGIFFYSCLDRRLARAYATVGLLCVVHGLAIAAHLWSSGP